MSKRPQSSTTKSPALKSPDSGSGSGSNSNSGSGSGSGTPGSPSSASVLLAANAPATPKISSLLNPSSPRPSSASNTPTLLSKSLPDAPPSASILPTKPESSFPTRSLFNRPHARSVSAIQDPRQPPSPASTSTLVSPIKHVTSEPSVSPYTALGITLDSSSPEGLQLERRPSASGTMTPPNGFSTSWWGRKEWDTSPARRPWKELPKRKKTVPEEQTEGWVNTRQRVAQAAASVLGTMGDAAHEALLTSFPLLDFVPVPGLASAAHVLLTIWDALQLVDTNRLQCLRLTERCANILMSVREEVKEAGDLVGEELAAPISKLIQAFSSVHNFLQKQVHRPFLKRYLKRDEILGQIKACDEGLSEALGMFGLSIQIRILKQVQETERKRLADRHVLFSALGLAEGEGEGLPLHKLEGVNYEEAEKPSLLPPYSAPSTAAAPSLVTSSATMPITAVPPNLLPVPEAIMASPSRLRESQILPTLKSIHETQNSIDAAKDSDDLRALMRAALQTSSDAEMLGVLQIGREEMPEAIKTLQRALERVGEEDEGEEGVESGAVEGTSSAGAGKIEAAQDISEKDRSRLQEVVSKLVMGRDRTSTSASASSGSSRQSTSGTGRSRSSNEEKQNRDTLDREFIESGIDALRRMSHGVQTNLPSWTITRYEVDREQKIGIGYFSDVYRGTWRGRTVAIKVLAPTTPRALFVREVGIWEGLRHRNVLELYGASSASGERPWFLVSAYMKLGTLVEFLKRVNPERDSGVFGSGFGHGAKGRATFPVWDATTDKRSSVGSGSRERRDSLMRVSREHDLFRFMLEIAKGMGYLHANGVLHGDLKAANVLVADDIRCVISDFGQSEMRSEVYRISGTWPHGTLRWQAPELMSAESQLALTPQMDVYAYAISCVEIVSWGKMPWPLMDDDAVSRLVLQENQRPPLPLSRYNTPSLQELLRVCWHRDPDVRPSFEKIADDVRAIRKAFFKDGGSNLGNGTSDEGQLNSPTTLEAERDRQWEWGLDQYRSKPSPDMRPGPLPGVHVSPIKGTLHELPRESAGTNSSFVTAHEDIPNARPYAAVAEPQFPHEDLPFSHSRLEDTVSSSRIHMPEPVLYTPSEPSTRNSSLYSHTPSSRSLDTLEIAATGLPPAPSEANDGGLTEGYESPSFVDERVKSTRDERRYRLLLSHQFHPSLTLPLWTPSPVHLGAVGYLSKPEGKFVTLFNSFHPEKSAEAAARELPSLFGYGRVKCGSQRQDKRNAAQRGYDAFVGLLTFRGRTGPVSQHISRRYSFPLRAGHKSAQLCTETTMYRYMERLEVPKRWFKANVDIVLQIYGPTHHIQKEDLFLVIGTLDTPDYALLVSHTHPDGQAHFNVLSSQRNGAPWGMFTTDTEVPPELGGPTYDEPVPANLSASKVSSIGGPWNTVLIARLRFKPDVLEPTSV